MWEYISLIFQKGLECYKIETCMGDGADKMALFGYLGKPVLKL